MPCSNCTYHPCFQYPSLLLEMLCRDCVLVDTIHIGGSVLYVKMKLIKTSLSKVKLAAASGGFVSRKAIAAILVTPFPSLYWLSLVSRNY